MSAPTGSLFPSLRTLALPSLTTGALLLGVLSPSEAAACGGTFCDTGPTAMPVDQSGETIVFAPTATTMAAHIQIEYEGDPEKFAWIVPVMSVPEVRPGSQQLFDLLLDNHQTVLSQNQNFLPCADDEGSFGCGGLALASEDAAAGGFSSGGLDGGDDGGGGVEILDRGFAGAFEFVTLTGGSVDEVVAWLDMAGYQQDPESEPILDLYLQEDFVFVAFKLRSGAALDAIHPIVVEYEGDEPCIPIRLTAIAATPDMAIRAVFLDDARWAPMNYKHVVLNDAALNWTPPGFDGGSLGNNYDEVVSLAVDEAGGRAFVTEYAGPSLVPAEMVNWTFVDANGLDGIEAIQAVNALRAQGLQVCDSSDEDGKCIYDHPLTESLLSEFLPVPPGVSARDFYQDLAAYEGLIDVAAWNAAQFRDAFEERIELPAKEAAALVARPYLTKLFTTISPEEMIEDPLFHKNEALQDEALDAFSSTYNNNCDGPDFVELNRSERLVVTEFGDYPTIEGMPSAERIEMAPANGPMIVEVDNAELIEELLDEHNKAQEQGPEGCRIGSRKGWWALMGLGLLGLRRPRRRSSN